MTFDDVLTQVLELLQKRKYEGNIPETTRFRECYAKWNTCRGETRNHVTA